MQTKSISLLSSPDAQALFPLCLAVPYLDMTSWWFAADAGAINLFLM